MLKGIPNIISPEALKILDEMGHGDEIVIADANFPAMSKAKQLVRFPGIGGCELLKAILQLMPLDHSVNNAAMLMAVQKGDSCKTPKIWDEYKDIIKKSGESTEISFYERFEFYEKTEKAFAVFQTGESALYANILLKKGVL